MNMAKLATALGTSASQADKSLSKQMLAINILNDDEQEIDKPAVPTMKQRHKSRDHMNMQTLREKLNNSTLVQGSTDFAAVKKSI